MYMPPIESDVPLDDKAEVTLPRMDEREELEVRARTIQLIADLTGEPAVPEEFHMHQARQIIKSKDLRNLSELPNETTLYLRELVSRYDYEVVRNLADLKTYTTHKLLELTNDANPKIQLGALKLLGEIDGIDAFKKRTEITVQQKSTEDIERELMEKLDKYTIDMEEVEIEDIDAEPSAD
jgi:hypothetical protein